MKKKIPASLILPKFLLFRFSLTNLHSKVSSSKVKLSLFFILFYISLWAQHPPFNADGTIVVPAGVLSMNVEGWGAGGAGGGASNSVILTGRSGAGGGGGAYAQGAISVTAGTTLQIKVAPTVLGNTGSGGNGGNSYIQGYEGVFFAAGGSGGPAYSGTVTPTGGAGGSSTVSKGSITTTAGNPGGDGAVGVLNLLSTSGAGGKAGGTAGGAGGPAAGSILLGLGPGQPGTPPGGGGSGGLHLSGSAAQSGGNGAAGRVNVTYTCPTYSVSSISASNVCVTSGTSSVTLASTPAGLPVGPYVVKYNTTNPAQTGQTVVVTVITAGSLNFQASGLTTVGTSTITVTNLTSGVCSSNINSTSTVTVSPATVGGSVSGGTTICSGATSAALTLAGHTGTILKWQSSTDSFATSTDIANTSTTYTSGPLTQTTQFRAVLQSGTCSAVNSNPTTVTVNPLPQGSLTANGPFCETGTGQLTFTASTGTGPFTVVYNDGTADRTVTGVVSGTPFNTFTTPVTSTTSYTLVSVTGANTCVRNTGFTGPSATININPLPQGSLTANGPFCVTGAGQLTFTASAGTGPYTVVYNDGTADRTVAGVVSGIPFNTFTTPVTSTTSYTLVSVTGANTCVRNTGFTGPSATINITPLPQGSLTANGPFCETGSGQLTFTASTGTGPFTVVYNDGTANRTVNNVASGTPFNTVINPVTATTNYTLVSVTGANSCVRSSGFTGASATITVNPLPQGSLTANGPFCATGTGQLTFTASTGTGPFTVVYNDGTANRTVNNVASGTPFNTVINPVTATTNYTLISVTGANTCVRTTGFTGASATITVNPLPSTPVIGTVTQPTCVTPTGSIVLNSLISTPNNLITQYGTVSQTYTPSGTTYTVSNLSPGTYSFTIQDASGCPSVPTANVEILPPVTNTWNGTSWSKGSEPVLTDAIRFSGNYSTTGNLNGCSCLVDSGVNVTVNSNHTLTITNAVTNSGGILTFENNSSLLQTTNAVNTGNIIYKRNSQPVRRYDGTYWSSPVTRVPAFKLYDFSPATLGDKFLRYDPMLGWVVIYNGNQEMIKGTGYGVRAPQPYDINIPQVFPGQFTGVPNNGDILGPDVVAEKFSVYGNPYPSAIYADQFIHDNSANIYGTLYFWTHNSLPKQDSSGDGLYHYSNDDFAIYNLSGSIVVGGMSGTPSPNPGNQSVPQGYIAAGQGFMVKARTNQKSLFTNSMRVSGNNSQFFKSSETITIERHRVWLNLYNNQGAFKQLLIGYATGATNFWDNNFDAMSMDAHPTIDFYSINENKKLAIQGRALPFTVSDTIPLGYRSAIQGEFTIAIDHADGSLNTQAIYLQDNVTKKVHNLTTGNYTFTTATGNFYKRFVLRYTDPNDTLGNEDFSSLENSISVSVKDKIITLQSFSDYDKLQETSIYDVGGKLLYNKKGIDNKEWRITNLRSGPQVLLVKVTLDNDQTITKKIIFN
ncbi:hypothetical protein HYN56_03995 [Flavobacterium crocinum]|uniref:Glycine-rich domain-containing protein n=1 Tax=Flavobacterium crocinum TaxID=2183896 RepID=A0A2S1YHA6_9FLAO|nr:T9SS sorting signal type C domain-containing protein [Flavobacterium crocinum]AWK03427.1 hypothetical protein HYN56_03995 [Flavobacterium crocinum]